MSEQVRGRLEPVYALQRDPRRRWLVAIAAASLGLALASVHWIGLLAGGALVGWTAPTLWRALAAGLAFGILALVTFSILLAFSGTLAATLGMGLITVVMVAIPLVLGLLGGLTRGLGRDAPIEPPG